MVKPAEKVLLLLQSFGKFYSGRLQLLEIAMAKILQDFSNYFVRKIANCPFLHKLYKIR